MGVRQKTYVVFFHYNKIYSRQHGVDRWSVHYRGVCHIAEQIKCYIPTFSRTNKKQPRVVMTGKASSVVMEDGIVTIR